MKTANRVPGRRRLLQAGMGAALAQYLASSPAVAAEPAPQPAAGARGQPGDFDFLTGEWRIQHRRLKDPGSNQWDEFKGEASCFGILRGVASIEELRIPERDFYGMGLRLLDTKSGIWSDFWVNRRDPVLSGPGLTGGFADGVGTFTAEDKDGDRPVIVRGVWDLITPKSCRWRQGVSSDGGRTWTENWFMDWQRV